MLRFHINEKDYKITFEHENYLKLNPFQGQSLVTNQNHLPLYDKKILESNKFCEPILKKYSNVIIKNEIDNGHKVSIERPTFLSCHTSSYHHFLIDTIGAILFLKSNNCNNFNIKTIVQRVAKKSWEEYRESHIKKFHQEVFSYLNLGNYEDSFILFENQDQLVFDNIVTVNYPSAPLDSFYPVINNIRNYFLKNREVVPDKKIYIGRKNILDVNNSRHIVDEEILQDYLKSHGYETVFFEDLSFVEQIDIVSRSSHIITHNGSSMVNTLFSQNNTQIVEIRNSVLQQHDAYMFWSEWFNKKHYIVKCFGSNSSKEIIDAIEFDDQIIL